jgi:hypothetical protein
MSGCGEDNHFQLCVSFSNDSVFPYHGPTISEHERWCGGLARGG